MKNLYVLLIVAAIFAACNQTKETKMDNNNPFFSEYNTPFGVPPFDQIKNEHFMPAFEKGIKEQAQEIEAIVSNSEEPTFENTIVALDECGYLLKNINNVFNNLTSAVTSPELQGIAKEVSPKLSKHYDDIYLNAELFKKVKAVYSQIDNLQLNEEQSTLLDKTFKRFERGGANLPTDKQTRFREVNTKLSLLTIKYGENLLSETNNYKLVIDNKDDLSGIPESFIQAAQETANEYGETGKWVFTLHKPSMIPFLQFAENRNLRKKLYTAYLNRCNNNDEFDNKEIAKDIVTLRLERSVLLGYNNHAAYILDNNMAKTPENVFEKLNYLFEKATPLMKQEAKMLQGMIEKDGKDLKLAPCDWWYYAEKIKQEKYNINEDEVRPYFKLENVRDGLFAVVNKLYGLEISLIKDIPKPHPDAEAYEIKDADGSHIGILYMDFYPRASKRSGAWMDSYRKQTTLNGEFITPVITNVLNFTKPTGDKPALLNFDEAQTMFHEFGHALHGLLSKCNYYSLSGTSVARDFVELPAQVLENWALAPEVLRMYAKHYKTGEIIPDDLIEKINNTGHFNQGFAMAEYLAASILDMKYHTLTNTDDLDITKFEKEKMEEIGLIPEILPRYRSTYFSHIFAGGYSAGYYSYIWAEVLDADAFAAFEETGDIFNQEKATAFRTNILEKGGSVEPMKLYKAFRGCDPKMEALLKRRGIL